MDSRKCQTSTATPPEAGGLPWVASHLAVAGNQNGGAVSEGCLIHKIRRLG